MDKNKIIERVFKEFEEVRYVAVYKENDLLFKQKGELDNNSEVETDKYEELLVNPVLLKLAEQRGNIDCGGVNFIIIGYGNFYQLIKHIENGHVSICLDLKSDATKLAKKIIDFLNVEFPELYK